MSKDFVDPFARPPALCTRRASQTDRVEQPLERAGMDSTSARGPSSDTVGRPPTSEHSHELSTYATAAPHPRHVHELSTPTTAVLQPRQVPDRYAPPIFDGISPDAEKWLAHMRRYTTYRQMSEADQLAAFPLFLKEAAIDWYDALEEDVQGDLEQLLDEFKTYFCPSALDHALRGESVFTRVQRPSERVRDYVAAVQKLARHMPHLDEQIIKYIVLRGLLPRTKAFVLAQRAETIPEILAAAKIAETAGIASAEAGGDDLSEIKDEIRASRAEVRQLSSRMDRMTTNVVTPRSPSPIRGYRDSPARRVTFGDPQPESSPRDGAPAFRRFQRGQPRSRGRGTMSSCDRCGRTHGGICPAMNVHCFACGRRGHLKIRCRSGRRMGRISH